MLTPYPQIVEYNEAVQNPQTAFRDAELRQGRVNANALGLPIVLSGGFALTYMMATSQRPLALRCFHREIPAAEQKYAAISRSLGALRSRYFVGFDFVPDGIRIRGGFYPVLKMDWAEGDTLGGWLDRYSGDRRAVEWMRNEFAALAAFIEQHGIAHGDIQNGNVIVSPKGLKLVDYDGLYVPGMPVEFGCETGHKHFQHPQRATVHFGPQIDRFSFIAVDLSLAALIEDPSLHRRFRQGGETILFRANDFAHPDASEIFCRLEQQAPLREAARNFAAICKADIGAVPSLADFRAARNIPADAAVRAKPADRTGTSAAAYIGPCPIIAAEDFATVSRFIGQRVELVGRVKSVRRGAGNDGRGGAQPCVTVDFSPPRGDGVEVTVLTDGAAPAPRDFPDASWVGNWASVVGLINPPRVERGFWSNRTRIGISTGNAHEIEPISEHEARYRLQLGQRSADTARPGRAVANRHLVSRLLNSGRAGGAAANAPRPAAPHAAVAAPGSQPSRSNRAILGALRRDVAPAPAPTAPSPAPAVPRRAAAAAPRSRRVFIPPRAAAAMPPLQPQPAVVQPPPPARPAIPRSGSFVIHPRNRRPPSPEPAPAAPPPTAWQRVLQFLGIEG